MRQFVCKYKCSTTPLNLRIQSPLMTSYELYIYLLGQLGLWKQSNKGGFSVCGRKTAVGMFRRVSGTLCCPWKMLLPQKDLRISQIKSVEKRMSIIDAAPLNLHLSSPSILVHLIYHELLESQHDG